MKNNQVINGVFREVPASSKRAHTWAAILPAICAVIAGGAGFGLWSGDAAMFMLLIAAAVALLIGLQVKTGKRVSSIFAVSALAGLAGIALVLASINVFASVIGLALAGLSLVVLSKIAARGWDHA